MIKKWKDKAKIEIVAASIIKQSQNFAASRGSHSMKRGNLWEGTAYSNEKLTSLSAPKLLQELLLEESQK